MATPKSTKPHGNLKDISGKTFGRLCVIRRDRTVNSRILWLCLCECGNTVSVLGGNLTRGLSTSCGASKHRVKHGMNASPEYKAWAAAKDRCFNEACAEYRNYGARGISMCAEWAKSFQSFYDHVGDRPIGMSLDRIDNNKNYQPGNVRWATTQQQLSNRRNSAIVEYNGVRMTLKEASLESGVPLSRLHSRYHMGKELFGPHRGRYKR